MSQSPPSAPIDILTSYDVANQFNDGTTGFANTAATITQFTGTAIGGAVPEPASWLLMIGDFGIVDRDAPPESRYRLSCGAILVFEV